MKSALSLVMVVCSIGWTVPVSAQEIRREPMQGPITRAAVNEAVRLTLTQQQQTSPARETKATQPSWMHRHPAATGALIGAAAGALLGAAGAAGSRPGTGGCPECGDWRIGMPLLGGVGAGLGAVVGEIIGSR